MRVNTKKLFRQFWFEGDPDAEAAAAAAAAAAAGKGEKLLTQAEVDKLINKRFASLKSEREQTLADYKKLQESASLTAQEKEELSVKITSLEELVQTKEEKSKNEIKKLESKYQTETQRLATEATQWKGMFEDSTIKRSLTDAAVSEEVESVDQIVMMFRGATRLEEVKDDSGKGTGTYLPMMKFQGIDPDTKKPASLDMTPAEALKHMRDNGLHKNLFKHRAQGGTGGVAGGGKGKGDPSAMPKREDYADQAQWQTAYLTWRENFNHDGTPKKKA